MRIFLAGATGAVGQRLIPLLASAGHSTTGLTRSRAKAPLLVQARCRAGRRRRSRSTGHSGRGQSAGRRDCP